jgi:hypothetical protein
MGIKIIVSTMIPERQPRMKLTDTLQVTEKFRAEMNAWLLEFFGEEPVVLTDKKHFLMHPNTAARLKHSMNRYTP